VCSSDLAPSPGRAAPNRARPTSIGDRARIRISRAQRRRAHIGGNVVMILLIALISGGS